MYTKPPRVMVPDGEWEDLCKGLLTKGICGLIREDQVHRIGGKPLFNGLFGVPKDEMDGSTPVHRLIMNLIPLNRICRSMSGDISTLPAWPSMVGVDQVLMVSSEDVRCFSIFSRLQMSGAGIWHLVDEFPHVCVQTTTAPTSCAAGCCRRGSATRSPSPSISTETSWERR